ncbi:MAG: rrf2 family protein [Acidobacteria bacterium OLB17]|nr:MAG: rrf2 family protein [Acidobacteria bacterium OLB17]MCZ2391756.1 Rrf2 family transcriptional regulator [Acidobacteriota bacterium]
MAANSQFAMAVHILTLLARKGDQNLKSDAIAHSVNTNPVVIRRVLGQLGHAGLVASQTGASGGTRLVRTPENICLVDVYKAVSCGEVFALPTRPASQDCPVGRNIESVLCNLQKAIDRSVAEKLGEFTLARVLEMIDTEDAVAA